MRATPERGVTGQGVRRFGVCRTGESKGVRNQSKVNGPADASGYRKLMSLTPTFENTRSAEDLARTLGWEPILTRGLRVACDGALIDIRKGVISGEPAAVFGTVLHRNGHDPLNSAALYAYHASAPWGVLADQEGLTVFSSQWLSERDWFRLPRISWDQVSQEQLLLNAFTPEGLLTQAPARVAAHLRQPAAFLKPIDDSLVERLDGWRDQALRFARSTDRVDELLQTFYAQLFVLRTVEDRGLNADVRPISSAVSGNERFDRGCWAELLGQAQQLIGSDLFENDVTTVIPEHVLAGVVRELYKPHGVPGDARYNFAWIDADVLGMAYEKYLASVLHPSSLPSQVDLFLPPEREVERFSTRKISGAYYTPKFITQYLATILVDDFFAGQTVQFNIPSVIDFACGSGSFLVAAIDKMLTHLKKADPDRQWAKDLIQGGYVVGVDIDEKAVTAARLHVWQRLIEEPDALPLPSLTDVIRVGDGLDSESWGPLNKKYDIVLGNPPFLTTSLVGARADMEARFEAARGRYDYSSLFVEQAVRTLRDDGRLGMVVPNRLLRNKSGGPVRRLLVEEAHLETVVDFGSTQPFDADAYIACVIAHLPRDADEIVPAKVRVIQVSSLDRDFLAATLLAAHHGQTLRNGASIISYEARYPRGEIAWLLLSEEEQISRIQIEESSQRLDTIAAIPQGIRTGGNDFFFVDLVSDDSGPLSSVTNGFGETFLIETRLLELSVYGSQVRRYEEVNTSSRLIYPYRGNVAISEAELERDYPNAWIYFQRNREVLSARSSLKRGGRRYYELVWPRDERWLRKPKLMIRDLAPSTAFAADQIGQVFLVGGTAVVPENPELLLPLLAYLNSSLVNRLVQQTTPQFRGSFQKFEPQHIQSIPVFDRLLEDETFFGELSLYAKTILTLTVDDPRRLELERQIDALITLAAAEQGMDVGHA